MYFSVYIFSPFVFNFLIKFSLGWKMSMESSVYLVFTDEASHHKKTWLPSAWVVYSPEGQLVSSGGIFLRPSMNNVVKYSVVIEILRNSISHGISSLEVRLDSQFVLCHLKDSYRVRDPTLLGRFLRVQLLERHFDFITYHHIPRSSNYVSDAYTNYVLDWNLSHN
jgi:ribonuclease HI